MVTEARLREIMSMAEQCHAWPVALMIAKDLNDVVATERFADESVDILQWHIPLAERTPERLEEEKQKILVGVK